MAEWFMQVCIATNAPALLKLLHSDSRQGSLSSLPAQLAFCRMLAELHDREHGKEQRANSCKYATGLPGQAAGPA